MLEDRPDCLDGEVHLELDRLIHPVQMPLMLPIAVQDQLKAELERMEIMGVLEKVRTPSEWV